MNSYFNQYLADDDSDYKYSFIYSSQYLTFPTKYHDVPSVILGFIYIKRNRILNVLYSGEMLSLFHSTGKIIHNNFDFSCAL